MIDVDVEPTPQIGGAALVGGYLLALVVFFRDPSRGMAAATAGIQPFLFFLAFPAAGVAVGVYAYLDGPHSAGASFLAATYLGFLGLGLALVLGVSSGQLGAIQWAGRALVALSVVSMTASVGRLVGSLGFGGLASPPSDRSDR